MARLADMLLHPGEEYEFDGQRLRYPDIRPVYWAGNAFHHHQDLNQLCGVAAAGNGGGPRAVLDRAG